MNYLQYELLQPFELPEVTLPTKNECLLYVVSRTINKIAQHNTIILELSRKVEDIWNKADCSPYTFKHIAKLFDKDIWQRYLYLKREKHLPGEQGAQKRSHHKKNPTKVKSPEPVRKSARCTTVASRTDASTHISEKLSVVSEKDKDSEASEDVGNQLSNFQEVPQPVTRKQQIDTVALCSVWNSSDGSQLFDVKSDYRAKKCVKEGYCFGNTFYEDQKMDQKLRMMLTKGILFKQRYPI